MNLGINYDINIERENNIDRISGVVSEYESEISTTPDILSCSKAVRTGSGQKNQSLSIHLRSVFRHKRKFQQYILIMTDSKITEDVRLGA